MKNLKKDNKGFSLVELLVVIAIMVVLVGVVAPTLLNNIEKSREAKDVQYLDSIASAIQSCLADEKAFDEISKATALTDVKDLYDASKFARTSTIIGGYFAQADVDISKLGSTQTGIKAIKFQYTDGHIKVAVVNDAGATITGKRGTLLEVSR